MHLVRLRQKQNISWRNIVGCRKENNWQKPFQWLRRFYASRFSLRCFNGFAVSMLRVSRYAVLMASPFLCFAFLVTLFEWLKPFLSFAFLAALFEWLKPFLSFAFLAGEQKVCRASWLLDCETVSLRASKPPKIFCVQ